MENEFDEKLKDKVFYFNGTGTIILSTANAEKIYGVLLLSDNEVAKVAAEKGFGTSIYYAALSYMGAKGLQPNRKDISDDAGNIWKYKFQNFTKKRLEEYSYPKERDFLNYVYYAPNEDFISYFINKTKILPQELRDRGLQYVNKVMELIYGSGINIDNCKKHELVFVRNIFDDPKYKSEWKCSKCGKTKKKTYYNKIEG